RLVNFWRSPPIGDHTTVEHVLECTCATTGGVFFFSCGNERRTHKSPAIPCVSSAFSDPNTSVDGISEISVVCSKSKTIRGHFSCCRRSAKIRIQGLRPNDDAGVQHIIGVKKPLETGHQFQRLVTVHGVEQLGTSTTIAMLT